MKKKARVYTRFFMTKSFIQKIKKMLYFFEKEGIFLVTGK